MGKQSNEIAQDLVINVLTARRTRLRYLDNSLQSIYDQPRSGRKSKIPNEYIEAFKALIVKEQSKRGDGRLRGEGIR